MNTVSVKAQLAVFTSATDVKNV